MLALQVLLLHGLHEGHILLQILFYASRQRLPVDAGLPPALRGGVVNEASLGLDEGGEQPVVIADVGQLVQY